MILICQSGYEDVARAEEAACGWRPLESGAGWIRVESPAGPPDAATLVLCFSHRAMLDPVELRGDGVNQIAGALVEWFTSSLRGVKVEGEWPMVFVAPIEVPGLGRRLGSVESAFKDALKKRVARVARLARDDVPRGSGPARGLFVWAADFGRLFASRETWLGGQRRMGDDPLAPSRSYLKVEEAYGLAGVEPSAGETVVDLGAAPGGWSYSAARRGAIVTAVDNGPLKGGALGHPGIRHLREDAFKFHPAAGERFDWLFCDLVEEPHHVLDLLHRWVAEKWCRRFVVNLKFGRTDAVALLETVRRSSRSPAFCRPAECARLAVRHLFHDREEFTLVGEV
jgi:23S rRNA (cytidine2498-2'-O)-methyltransferase